jgi:N-acetylglucosaminyldiphosphoundecaprenol N-acetyl-beta-D-mannosaminyltransferase
MTYASLNFLDVRIDVLNEATAVEHIAGSLEAGRGGWVATPNVDQLRILSSCADLLSVADGMPLIWASHIQGSPLPERVSGSHLIWSLTTAGAISGRSHFILSGTSHDVAEMAAKGPPSNKLSESGSVCAGHEGATVQSKSRRGPNNLREKNPPLKIAGFYSPPYGFERDSNEVAAIRDKVSQAMPDIVFCGLGFPKQERLIQGLRMVLPRTWFVACGASISMVAGERSLPPNGCKTADLSGSIGCGRSL